MIVGSKPTQKDSLWRAMASAGFKVETEQRNFANKEKKVDTGIVQKINKNYLEKQKMGMYLFWFWGTVIMFRLLKTLRLMVKRLRLYFGVMWRKN